MLNQLFTGDVLFFSIPAILGSLVFLAKMGLMLIGGDGGDFDADVDVDLDLDGGDSTSSFNLLSIQAIAALLMGFGWGGIAAYLGFHQSILISTLVGIGCGVLMVWVLGLLMKAVYDLQSSGNISIRDAIGREGVVYAGVPEHGTGHGQVRVVIGQRQRIYNAVSDSGAIPTNTTVRVVKVNGDNTITVQTT